MASHGHERELTQSSVGFMSKDDFKRQREELEHKEALQKMRKATEKASEDRPDGDKPKKKAKKEKKRPGALSFEDELEAEAEPSPTIAPKKMGKCQDVNASFLGKNEREKEEEAAKQEQVLRDYLLEQQKAKDEPLTLAYTYRSEVTQRELPNAVHKGIIEVKRGFTAEQVARAVHLDTERLGEKFQGKRVAGIRVEERDVMLIANAGESPCASGQNRTGSRICRACPALPPASLSLRFGVCRGRWGVHHTAHDDHDRDERGAVGGGHAALRARTRSGGVEDGDWDGCMMGMGMWMGTTQDEDGDTVLCCVLCGMVWWESGVFNT